MGQSDHNMTIDEDKEYTGSESIIRTSTNDPLTECKTLCYI